MTAYVASPMNSHPRTGLNYVFQGWILFILSSPYVVLGAKLIVSLSCHVRPKIISKFIFITRVLLLFHRWEYTKEFFIENMTSCIFGCTQLPKIKLSEKVYTKNIFKTIYKHEFFLIFLIKIVVLFLVHIKCILQLVK